MFKENDYFLAYNWKRVAARIFDLLLFIVIYSLLFFLFQKIASSWKEIYRILLINGLVLPIFFLYFVCLSYILKGRTLGKLIFRIRLQSRDQQHPPFYTLLFRETYIFMVPLVFITAIYFLFALVLRPATEQKQINLVLAGQLWVFWYVFLFVFQKINPQGQLFYDRWMNLIVIDDRRKKVDLRKHKKYTFMSEKIKNMPKESAITKSLSILNSEQQQAVLANPENNLLIIAGPGTGKTTVLTERYLHFVRHFKIPIHKILALTFTRRTCANLENRLKKEIQLRPSKTSIFTYHSFCYYFLSVEKDRLSLQDSKKGFLVLDQQDAYHLIKDAILQQTQKNLSKKKIEKETIRVLANIFSFIQELKIDNEKDFFALWQSHTHEIEISVNKYQEIWQTYSIYEHLKQKNNFFDFGDLLLKTYNLLKSDEILLAKWQARFSHLLIDEFQDISDLQYSLIELLSAKGKKIKTTVVGDPDQTIYGWRNAKIEHILNFNKKFREVKTVKLIKNYRSTQNIVQLANLSIKKNKKRISKNIFSQLSRGSKIQLRIGSQYDQAKFITQKVQDLIIQGEKPDKIAIFYRSNYLSGFLESFLLQAQVPYLIFKGFRFFARREIKDLILLLTILIEPTNFYFEQLLLWVKNIGSKTIQKFKLSADKLNLSLFEYILTNMNETTLTRYQSDLKTLILPLKKLQNNLSQMKSFRLLCQELITNLYAPFLERYIDKKNRINNLNTFLEIVINFEKTNIELALNQQIERFLAETKIYLADDFVDNHQRVNLMTLHGAKGLEFKHVFLFQVTEEIFPSRLNLDIEEERRLFFVGLTRAQQHLYITADFFRPSIFVQEIMQSPLVTKKDIY